MKLDIQDKIEEKTCLHRFVGDCKKCLRDYDSSLNNTHCPSYFEIHVVYYETNQIKDIYTPKP